MTWTVKTEINLDDQDATLVKKNIKGMALDYLRYTGEIIKDEQLSLVIFVYDSKSLANVDDCLLEVNSFDHCYKLQKMINKRSNYKIDRDKLKWIPFLIKILRFFLALINTSWPVIKYSSIASQVQILLQRSIDALNDIVSTQKVSLKVLNLFSSLTVDVLLGITILRLISFLTCTEDFPMLFITSAEDVVTSLRDLLRWLSGSPAGFKLNHEFNNMLGKFFLFHTNIWWLFLVFIRPALGIVFQIFTILGNCGLSLQAAIASDLLALVSFHIYCIYAYAARLYNIQLSGLVSLWRLFLGRKKNPLREKVDSCQYSVDQLFVGTLLFTVLLFLLPTTLLYYIVFTASRLVIVTIGGILTRIRMCMHSIPLYSSILWLFGSTTVCAQIQIDVDTHRSSKDALVINVRAVPGNYVDTIRSSKPDYKDISTQQPSNVTAIFKQIVHGELLYPV